jgi:hypothetical protein
VWSWLKADFISEVATTLTDLNQFESWELLYLGSILQRHLPHV